MPFMHAHCEHRHKKHSMQYWHQFVVRVNLNINLCSINCTAHTSNIYITRLQVLQNQLQQFGLLHGIACTTWTDCPTLRQLNIRERMVRHKYAKWSRKQQWILKCSPKNFLSSHDTHTVEYNGKTSMYTERGNLKILKTLAGSMGCMHGACDSNYW